MTGDSGFLTLFFQSYLGFFGALRGVFVSGAWLLFIPLFFFLFFRLYMEVIRRKYIASLTWTFLRIRVPELNLRTPRAMEELLNGFHGLQRPPDLYDLYLDGYVQSWLSLEVRGTRDDVTFILRVPAGNRDLIEAAVYSQYPDAEIDEVADYTTPYTLDRLEQDFDLWATELILNKEDAYPIKTYVDFEDQFAEDSRLVDSMALLTEFVSALKPGEEIWLQVLIRPVIFELFHWQEEGMRLALKLAGREPPRGRTRLRKTFDLLSRALTVITTLGPAPAAAEGEEQLDLGALRLTPGETEIVKAIQRNVSKVGFQTKIRAVAIGPAAVFKRRTRIPLVFGMFRPFTSLNLNSFRPESGATTSRPVYGFVKIRQRFRKRRLLRKYKARYFREKGFVLNVEELATVYHFPVAYVRTPVLERARAKRGEAPTNVPLAPEELPVVQP